MSDDPIQAIVDRAKQELQAVNQQIEASRTTLRSLEESLKATQKQTAESQKIAAECNTKIAEAEIKARGIVDVANRNAQAVREKVAEEIDVQCKEHGDAMREALEEHIKAMKEAEARVADAEGRYRALQAAMSVAQQKLDAIKRQASVFAQSLMP